MEILQNMIFTEILRKVGSYLHVYLVIIFFPKNSVLSFPIKFCLPPESYANMLNKFYIYGTDLFSTSKMKFDLVFQEFQSFITFIYY